MSRDKSNDQSLGNILGQRTAGDREMEQIASVLLHRYENRRVRVKRPIKVNRIQSCFLAAGRSVCLYRWPEHEYSQIRDKFDKFRDSLKANQNPTVILFLDPFQAESKPSKAEKQFNQVSREFLERFPSLKSIWYDADALREEILEIEAFTLRYYPEAIPNGKARLREINHLRRRYDGELFDLLGKISFVGMAVY